MQKFPCELVLWSVARLPVCYVINSIEDVSCGYLAASIGRFCGASDLDGIYTRIYATLNTTFFFAIKFLFNRRRTTEKDFFSLANKQLERILSNYSFGTRQNSF